MGTIIAIWRSLANVKYLRGNEGIMLAKFMVTLFMMGMDMTNLIYTARTFDITTKLDWTEVESYTTFLNTVLAFLTVTTIYTCA